MSHQNIELNIYNVEVFNVKGLRFQCSRLQLIATHNISFIQEGSYILNKYYGIRTKDARKIIRSTLSSITNRSSYVKYHNDGTRTKYVFETLIG